LKFYQSFLDIDEKILYSMIKLSSKQIVVKFIFLFFHYKIQIK